MMEPPARQSRWAALFTSILLLVCYAPTLRGMARQWWNDEDMGHGFVVPIVIVWILWRERERWIAIPSEPSSVGFAILIAGACLHVLASLGAGLFAGSLALLLSITGAIVCLRG